MKKSEMKQLMKEAMKESLNESFVANMIEIVIRTTEKTLERKLDEKMEGILRKHLVNESKKVPGSVHKKKQIKKKQQIKEVKQEENVVFSKNPIINKMLTQTMKTTAPNEFEEYGVQTPDLSQLGQKYQQQILAKGDKSLNENVQLQIPTLTENLGIDTLQGSVMDNNALAGVFKRDYRKTLKRMEKSSGKILPEAVQFFGSK